MRHSLVLPRMSRCARLPLFTSLATVKKLSFTRYASSSPQSSKVKRILRRRVPEQLLNLQQCISASKCQRYDLGLAVKAFRANGISAKVLEHGEVAWAQYGKDQDVIVLANGSVVGWNFLEKDVVSTLVPLLAKAEIEPYARVETEDMDFIEEGTSETHSGMIGDVIYVHGPDQESRLRDKIAFSSGMARHTKLSALEAATEDMLQQVKGISNGMARGKSPNMSTHKVDTFTGRLLQLRGNLNLYSTITETPDIYWSQPEQEKLYELISKSLDVEPRIEILNKKLDYAADTVSVLRQYLSERTSLRLEWAIIILILIEVLIELRRFLFDSESKDEER